jgi:hypothetical protein
MDSHRTPPRTISQEYKDKLVAKFGHKGFTTCCYYRGKYTTRDSGELVTIENPEDADTIGIGIETLDRGDYLRAAVVMTDTPSMLEIQEAFDLLFMAIKHPEDPSVLVVRGQQELCGRTMQTTALKSRNSKLKS